MSFIRNLNPKEPMTESFKVKMFLLTFIAYVAHVCALIFSRWHSTIWEDKVEVLIPTAYGLAFLYFIFVLTPSLYIFRMHIPTIIKYVLMIAFPFFLFYNLELFVKRGSVDEGQFVTLYYSIYTLPIFCLFDLFGRVAKVIEKIDEKDGEDEERREPITE